MGYYTRFSIFIEDLNGNDAKEEFELLREKAKRFAGLNDRATAELKRSVLKDLEAAHRACTSFAGSIWEEFDYAAGGGDEAKWYEHEADMKTLSAAFPRFVFRVDGVGEDLRAGSIFRKWFHRGEMQGGAAELVYPELKAWPK